jgi:hypothetical protein
MCFESGHSSGAVALFVACGPVRSQPLTATAQAAVEAARARRQALVGRRKQAVDGMCEAERREGRTPDRMYWTMVYDFEMAPETNGRTLLLELGVVPYPPQDLSADAELHEALWTVLEALAAQRVYLLNTDHLNDRQLYERLFYKILDEPTQCMPPGSQMCEYIDVLHSMDMQGGFGAELERRIDRGAHPEGDPVEGERAPLQLAPICDRDRFLPRPPPPMSPTFPSV